MALACAQLATLMRGLSIPEFRKRFNLINDFTPEEEAEPFDEARIAELAEAREREEKAREEAQGVQVEEEKRQEWIRSRLVLLVKVQILVVYIT